MPKQYHNEVHSIPVNIFDVVESDPIKSSELQALSDLMILVREIITVNNWSMATAAKRLSMPPMDVKHLMRGDIEQLSINELVIGLYHCGYRLAQDR